MALLLKEIKTQKITKKQFAEYVKCKLLPEEESYKQEKILEIFAWFGPHFSVHVACVVTYGLQVTSFRTVKRELQNLFFRLNLNTLDRYKLTETTIETVKKELRICAANFETKARQQKQSVAQQVA